MNEEDVVSIDLEALRGAVDPYSGDGQNVLLLVAEIERLREALNGARRRHLIVEEDCWYSCRAAVNPDADPDDERWASCRDDGDHGCDCGADAHNARIDAALGVTS